MWNTVTDAAPLVNRPSDAGPGHPVLASAKVAIPDYTKTSIASAGVFSPFTPGAIGLRGGLLGTRESLAGEVVPATTQERRNEKQRGDPRPLPHGGVMQPTHNPFPDR